MIFGYDIVDVFTLFCACAGFLFAIVNFIRTGSLAQFFKEVNIVREEVEDMVYKTPNNRVKTTQSFTPYKKDYIYDKKTNSLIEKEEQIDVNALIQSVLPTAIETILKRYLDNGSIISNENDNLMYDYTDMRDKLEIMAEYHNIAEQYRDKYQLPDDWSAVQIYNFINDESLKLKEKIIKYSQVNKEVQNDEA